MVKKRGKKLFIRNISRLAHSSKKFSKKQCYEFLAFLVFFFLIISTNTNANETVMSESIGSYTAGCIRSSAALPIDGNGYQVVRSGRGRYFGHSEMIDFIENLSQKVSESLDGILLIGDIAQETGGPMPDHHNSHQTGLDADIFFWQHTIAKQRKLTTLERENTNPISLLTPDKRKIDQSKWNNIHGEILKLASQDPRVDRIFVNPIIKKKLCSIYTDESWLSKIRPWYKHDSHFHVRLKCPIGDKLCESQKPNLVTDSGCKADLDSWFTKDGSVKKRKGGSSSVQRSLPKECISIINQSNTY